MIDGKFSNTVDSANPGVIRQHATIRDDALHGDLDILCCVRVTPRRLVAATYEHVGQLDDQGLGQWTERLSSLTDRLLVSFPAVRGGAALPERPLFPHLTAYLKRARGPNVEQLLVHAVSARRMADAQAMSAAISVPLHIMAERSAVQAGPPEEVQEELVCAGEHVALFGIRSQQRGLLELSMGDLARFLVDDLRARPQRIDRGLRLSKYVCENGAAPFFEESALSYILGLCRNAVLRDRDDVIESAGWLIERLRKDPVLATRITMRLITKPPSLDGDKAIQGLEKLNRLDLASYVFDILDPITKDTSELLDSGDKDLELSTRQCPPEFPVGSDASRFPLWPPDGAPLRWVFGLTGRHSELAQRDILGFEILGDSDEVLVRPSGMYLRSFRQMRRLRVPNRFVADGSRIIPYPFEPRLLTLEAALQRSLMRAVSIFGVAGPHDAMGMGRAHTIHLKSISKVSDWRSGVTGFLTMVQFVVYVPDDTESLIWESSEIYNSGMIPHCVFVMLPKSIDERSGSTWTMFQQLDAPHCAHLPTFDPKGAFVWLDNKFSATVLPFDALYDRRLSDLVLSIAKERPA
jgi:hypothetical protein